MKKQKNLSRYFLAFIALAIFTLFARCQDENVVEPTGTEPTTDREALEKLVDEDSSLTSFDYNYDEEGVMEYLGKVSSEIYPFRVGQKMRLVNRTLSIDFQDTIAYGTLTKTFEGLLLIAASYDSNATEPDTLIKKPFTAVVTRKIIFKKIRDYQLPVLESSVVTESVLKADAAIFFNFPHPGIGSADFFHPLSFSEWKVKNDIIDDVHNAQLV